MNTYARPAAPIHVEPSPAGRSLGLSPQLRRLALLALAVGAWGYFLASTINGARHASQMIDFGSYDALGQAMLANLDPYRIATPAGQPGVAAYPPIFGMLMMPFSLLPLPLAGALWYFLTQGLLVAGAVLVLRLTASAHSERGLAAGAALASIVALLYPVWTNAKLGQVGALLFFLVVASLVARRSGQPIVGGALLGAAISIKLVPLPLMVYAFWVGWRRYSIATLLSFLGLQLVSAIWFGPLVQEYWFRILPGIQTNLGPIATNLALSNVVKLLAPSATSLGLISLGLSALALGLPFLLTFRRLDDAQRLLGFAWLIAGIGVAGPVVESHHLVWLLLPVWLLVLAVVRRPDWVSLALLVGSLLFLSQPYRLSRILAPVFHLTGSADLLGSAGLQAGVLLLYLGLGLALVRTIASPSTDQASRQERSAVILPVEG
jgi:hypothetical protein